MGMMRRWWSRLTSPTPPPLAVDHGRAEYVAFMKEEILRYTPAYARGRVEVRGQEKLLAALAQANVMVALLHHGSWILIGGVVRHALGIPYTVIASRRNFAVMSEEDADYWRQAHDVTQAYYGAEFIFTDQPPFRAIRWLKRRPAVLGVAFDVREFDQPHRESEIDFAGHRLWVQTGPARLAQLAKVLVVPATIHFDPRRRLHQLTFLDVLDPQAVSDLELTQAVFSALAPAYLAHERQAFFDMPAVFSRPHASDLAGDQPAGGSHERRHSNTTNQ